MALLISTAQRRFLVVASTVFFLSSVYFCVSRLVAISYKPVKVLPPPILDMDISKADYPMAYGRHGRPGYDGIKLTDALPQEYVPTKDNGRRLIIIGDIHGMLDPLEDLLKKTKFNSTTDHIISVGDMVNKGPKSAEVVRYLMQLNATAVRGNHEDRVLLAWDGLHEQSGVEAFLDSAHEALRRGEDRDIKTARTLSQAQIAWLKNLPVVLTIEPLSTYIVHAGLVPGLPIPNQDPWAIMNMRTLRFPREEFRAKEEAKRKKKLEEQKKKDQEKLTAKPNPQKRSDDNGSAKVALEVVEEGSVTKSAEFETRATPPADPMEAFMSHPDHDLWIPVDNRDGHPWSDIWNHFQKRLNAKDRRTIIYGHDAKRGYQEDKYTFGLDSACVKGHALTALVVWVDDAGNLKRTTIQAICKDPSKTWW